MCDVWCVMCHVNRRFGSSIKWLNPQSVPSWSLWEVRGLAVIPLIKLSFCLLIPQLWNLSRPFSQALWAKYTDAGVIWHFSCPSWRLEKCKMIEGSGAGLDKNPPPRQFLLEVSHPGDLEYHHDNPDTLTPSSPLLSTYLIHPNEGGVVKSVSIKLKRWLWPGRILSFL